MRLKKYIYIVEISQNNNELIKICHPVEGPKIVTTIYTSQLDHWQCEICLIIHHCFRKLSLEYTVVNFCEFKE